MYFPNINARYADIGSGLPFVFQHGLGGKLELATNAFAPIAGTRMLSFDFRGHGQTPLGNPTELNFETFSQDISDFLDFLQLDSAVIGGISMGAATALRFALRFPDRCTKLVLVRPAWNSAPMEPPARSAFEQLAVYLQQPDGKLAFLRSTFYSSLREQYPRIASSFLAFFDDPAVKRNYEIFLRIPLCQPNLSPQELSQIRISTLVISTRQDFIHPYAYGKALSEQIPGAIFFEAVSKSLDAELHSRQLHRQISQFLQS